MSSRLIPLIVLFLILDTYLYQSLHGVFGIGSSLRAFQIIFLVILLLGWFSLFKLDQKIRDRTLFRGSGINFYIGFLISSLVTKLIYCGVMLIYDLGRFVFGLFDLGNGFELPLRSDDVLIGVAFVASLAFLLMLYGITIGKYNYKLERQDLTFPDLPAAFDGFKIVQISDIHAGSYDNNRGLIKGIEMINAEKPDIILFTGDLVNDHKDEVDPYISDLKMLKSKYGTYAVLGNHDYYGAYRQSDKSTYWNEFFAKFEAMGFTLLNNQNHSIENQNASIKIVGVENWGNANWTPKRGDLDVALRGTTRDDFCILLTHDPSHWDQKVLTHTKKIHLSLAGHTHGFQFGINLPFFKWSPAKYRYPRWMGLYKEHDQYLYVNRGYGYLAFPGRVGMRPEITVLTLRCANGG